jgi:polysaccharide export outer membrane protein
VTYRYSPEYNATVALQPDGYVGLPLLGELSLGGLTAMEAQDRLVAKAAERLNAPEIVVELKEFEKPYYIIGGQVGAPGKFDYRGPISALRAIQIAGGFKDSAKASQVLLIRPINNVDAETRLINLKRVVDRRQTSEDVDLRPGDMLIVPKNWVSKVEPYIKLTNLGLYMNPAGF